MSIVCEGFIWQISAYIITSIHTPYDMSEKRIFKK